MSDLREALVSAQEALRHLKRAALELRDENADLRAKLSDKDESIDRLEKDLDEAQARIERLSPMVSHRFSRREAM